MGICQCNKIDNEYEFQVNRTEKRDSKTDEGNKLMNKGCRNGSRESYGKTQR